MNTKSRRVTFFRRKLRSRLRRTHVVYTTRTNGKPQCRPRTFVVVIRIESNIRTHLVYRWIEGPTTTTATDGT